MNGITTHVLDTSRGRPAAGVRVNLALRTGERWTDLGSAATDADGRITSFLPDRPPVVAATYRLRFDIGDYFADQGVAAFYPYVEVVFTTHEDRHHHVPLLINPFGYSTYRGT